MSLNYQNHKNSQVNNKFRFQTPNWFIEICINEFWEISFHNQVNDEIIDEYDILEMSELKHTEEDIVNTLDMKWYSLVCVINNSKIHEFIDFLEKQNFNYEKRIVSRIDKINSMIFLKLKLSRIESDKRVTNINDEIYRILHM